MVTLTLNTIAVIVDSPHGLFVAKSIVDLARKGETYYLPDGTLVNTSLPSALIQQLEQWSVQQRNQQTIPDYNQVSLYFAPQMAFATRQHKQRLLNDLMAYAEELKSELA